MRRRKTFVQKCALKKLNNGRVKSEEERTLRREQNQTESGVIGDSSPAPTTFWGKILSTEQPTEFYVDAYTLLMITVTSISLLR